MHINVILHFYIGTAIIYSGSYAECPRFPIEGEVAEVDSNAFLIEGVDVEIVDDDSINIHLLA